VDGEDESDGEVLGEEGGGSGTRRACLSPFAFCLFAWLLVRAVVLLSGHTVCVALGRALIPGVVCMLDALYRKGGKVHYEKSRRLEEGIHK